MKPASDCVTEKKQSRNIFSVCILLLFAAVNVIILTYPKMKNCMKYTKKKLSKINLLRSSQNTIFNLNGSEKNAQKNYNPLKILHATTRNVFCLHNIVCIHDKKK